jgi:predicted permease
MNHIISTIVPIFVIILLGLLMRQLGFLPQQFTGPLNRLVYYLAVPAMVFLAVAKAHFEAYFQAYLLIGTLIPVLLLFFLALIAGIIFSVPRGEMGTFLQSSYHGNIGYIGLAVAYYFLGEEGLTSAGILMGFLMLLQNFISVLTLELFAKGQRKGLNRFWFIFKNVAVNPLIIASMIGIAFSLFNIPLPQIVDRSLKILSGMALPLALLVIGASLSFKLIRPYIHLVLGTGFLKLIVLPAIGLAMYRWFGLSSAQFLPGLILLAGPTATVTYVMAREMGGSPTFASGAISMNTLLSGLTFTLWMGMSG